MSNSEETRLLIREGVGLLSLIFGRKRKKIQNVLTGVNDALTIYDEMVDFDKRLAMAALGNRGINLTAEEVTRLAQVLRRLKTLHVLHT